jgi:hypothetical protein
MNGAQPGIAVDRALRRVVQSYGRHALDDPVALRAALRACAPELPSAEVELLVTVGASGAWEPVRQATLTGTDPALAVPDAARAVQGATALGAADAERACRAFAAALVPAGQPAGRRIVWDTEGSPLPVTVPDGVAAPAVGDVPAGARRPRGRAVAAVAAGLAVVLAAVVLVVLTSGTGQPPTPDRFAVDQVAQRYRALGATLLDGALRCAPLPPDPGELERVDCSFGGWSVVLTGYDSAFRLTRVRELAVTAQPDAVRQAAATDPRATFAMRERSGADPVRDRSTATVYWDAQDPRPVSATITTTELSLPALARFWDTRGVATVQRPAVPGAEFDSAALWLLAAPFVERTGASCGPIPERKYPYYGAIEGVQCRYPNGATIDFNRVGNAEQLQSNRRGFASPDGTAPGSLRLSAWNADDDRQLHGQLIEYSLATEPGSHLYFDELELLTFARLYHPSLSQDQLKAFWADVRAG